MTLITGITGLVGSHLAIHLLESKTAVRGVYRTLKSIEKTKQVFEYYNKSHLFDKIDWVEADILDISSLENAFQNIQYVYHCAGLISFDPNDEEQLRKINVEGTANIVNFCLSKKVNKLCFISSIAALGDPINHQKINEETDWNPEKDHSDYAISKYGAEMEVWRAQQEGLSTIIVNPGVIIAPPFWKNGSGEIFEKVKKGLKFYTNGSTGFVTITDVILILTQLMKSNIESEKYILVAQNWSYKDLVFKIATAFKVKKPNIEATKLATTIAYKVDWIFTTFFMQKRKLSKLMAKSLHQKDLYDNQKIVNTLNYSFEDIEKYITKNIFIFAK